MTNHPNRSRTTSGQFNPSTHPGFDLGQPVIVPSTTRRFGRIAAVHNAEGWANIQWRDGTISPRIYFPDIRPDRSA